VLPPRPQAFWRNPYLRASSRANSRCQPLRSSGRIVHRLDQPVAANDVNYNFFARGVKACFRMTVAAKSPEHKPSVSTGACLPRRAVMQQPSRRLSPPSGRPSLWAKNENSEPYTPGRQRETAGWPGIARADSRCSK
jgi:hypothetical protein